MPKGQKLDRAEVLKALSTVEWITASDLIATSGFPEYGTKRALKELRNTGLVESRPRAMTPGMRGRAETEWRRLANGRQQKERTEDAAEPQKTKRTSRRRRSSRTSLLAAADPASDRIAIGVPRVLSAEHLRRLAGLAEAAASALNLGSDDPCVELVMVP